MKTLLISIEIIFLILNTGYANNFKSDSCNIVDGIEYFNNNNYLQALDYFNDFIKSNQNCPEAYYYRAEIYLSEKRKPVDYEKAKNDLNNAIRLNPVNGIYYFERAVCNLGLKNEIDYQNDMRKSIHFSPNEWLFYLKFGSYWISLNQGDSAIFYLSEIISNTSDNSIKSMAYIKRAKCFIFCYEKKSEIEKLDYLEKANNDLYESFKTDPNDPEALFYSALIFYQLGSYSQSIDISNDALVNISKRPQYNYLIDNINTLISEAKNRMK